GARESSESTATAANQSATTNLPNIFKSETALAKAKAPDIVNAAASASAATGTAENVSAGLSSGPDEAESDRKSTRLNSSHVSNSYAVFCLKKTDKANDFEFGHIKRINDEKYDMKH